MTTAETVTDSTSMQVPLFVCPACDARTRASMPNTAPPLADKHWYVDNPHAEGYCLACALPRSSGRHVARRAA